MTRMPSSIQTSSLAPSMSQPHSSTSRPRSAVTTSSTGSGASAPSANPAPGRHERRVDGPDPAIPVVHLGSGRGGVGVRAGKHGGDLVPLVGDVPDGPLVALRPLAPRPPSPGPRRSSPERPRVRGRGGADRARQHAHRDRRPSALVGGPDRTGRRWPRRSARSRRPPGPRRRPELGELMPDARPGPQHGLLDRGGSCARKQRRCRRDPRAGHRWRPRSHRLPGSTGRDRLAGERQVGTAPTRPGRIEPELPVGHAVPLTPAEHGVGPAEQGRVVAGAKEVHRGRSWPARSRRRGRGWRRRRRSRRPESFR